MTDFNFTDSDIAPVVKVYNFNFSYIHGIKDLTVILYGCYTDHKNVSALIRRIDTSTINFSAEISPIILYEINHIFTKNEYVYAAAKTGIDIFDLHTDNSLYFKEVQNVLVRSIWGNDTTLFFGGIGGLFCIDYINLHADYANSTISDSFSLKSTDVRYIHGKNKALLVTTSSGVEYFNWLNNPEIKSNTYIENAGKCFLTNEKAYYINYTSTSGILTYNLNVHNKLKTDWVYPYKIYSTGEGIFSDGIILTDLYITEYTAFNGGNTIFCTTSSGVYVIDEDTADFSIYL
jgi:hypothetical protein